jgi:hypothetical protein
MTINYFPIIVFKNKNTIINETKAGSIFYKEYYFTRKSL